MTWKQALKLLVIAMGILALDMVSKGMTHFYFKPYEHAPHVFPFGGIPIFQAFGIDFCIHHVTNRGAAWGMGGSWQLLILLIRIAVILGLAVYLLFSSKAFAGRYPLTLIIAGGLGNILDYFIYGHVIDMFHFIFWDYSYPVFNIADTSIFFGMAALLWMSLKKAKDQNAIPQN